MPKWKDFKDSLKKTFNDIGNGNLHADKKEDGTTRVVSHESKGIIHNDGRIEVNDGKVMPEFEDFLKKLHTSTCTDIAETAYEWNDGYSKGHFKVYGKNQDAKIKDDGKYFQELSNRVAADIIDHMLLPAKFKEISNKINTSPRDLTYDAILEDVTAQVNAMGGCDGVKKAYLQEHSHGEL